MEEDCLGGIWLIYIGGIINPGPSDQTDLKQQRRFDFKAVENRCLKERLIGGTRGGVACRWGQPAPLGSLLAFAVVVHLLECSGVYLSRFHRG
jgi:hypothetical protein